VAHSFQSKIKKKDHPITSLRFRHDVRETDNRSLLLSIAERQGTAPERDSIVVVSRSNFDFMSSYRVHA